MVAPIASRPGVTDRLPAATDRIDGRVLDTALARADAYRVLAAAFHDPDGPEAPERLALRVLRAAATRLGADSDERVWEAARRIAPREPRAVEHRTIFGHTVAHGCPPYETEYGRRHVFGQAQDLGDIRGFYEAFGVRPRAHGERPDHVACELEFLGLLALKSAIALVTDDPDHQTVCHDAERRFIVDHPGRWLPALAGRIAERAPGSGYAAFAAIAAVVVATHARAIGALPVALEADDIVPITDEPDGLRFECGIDTDEGLTAEGV